MIENFVVFRDYETGSPDPKKCQPTQLAAIIIDLRRCVVVEDSLFNSYIRPMGDEEAIECGLDPIQDQALAVSKVSRETLASAPPLKMVWESYTAYLKSHAAKGGPIISNWDMPIRAGYNSLNFDDYICRRLCVEFGDVNAKGDLKIYHPNHNWDLFQLVNQWHFFHNLSFDRQQKTSFDQCREHFEYRKEGAHDASIDVIQGADLLCRFLATHKKIVGGTIDLPKGKKLAMKGCAKGKL